MIVATMETEHFSWVALGRDEEEARGALASAWDRHIAQALRHGAWEEEPMAGVEAIESYGAHLHELEPGQAMRDGSLI